MKVLTYNLRYATADDGHPWSARRQPMIDLITELAPDVIGIQEGLAFALADLADGLPGRYGWVGRGRGVGWDDDEFNAVFYDTTQFDVAQVTHRWLSDTPTVPASITWGSSLPRIYTHATLVDRSSGEPLEVVNTHLDYELEDAKLRSVAQLGELVGPWVQAGRRVVVTGDFNAAAGASEPYDRMVATGLVDAVATAEVLGPQVCSCPGYETPAPDGPRIDWIFTGPGLIPRSSRVVDLAPGGTYPSDHLPVEVVFRDS